MISDGRAGVGVIPVSPSSSVSCVVIVVVVLLLGDSAEVADVGLKHFRTSSLFQFESPNIRLRTRLFSCLITEATQYNAALSAL